MDRCPIESPEGVWRRRTRRLAAAGLLAASLAWPLAGCGRLGSDENRLARIDAEDRAGRPPDDAIGSGLSEIPPVKLAPTDATATRDDATTDTGLARTGNPAAWGEGARRMVGREFEPVWFTGETDEIDFSMRRMLGEVAGWLSEHPDVWMTLSGFGADRATREYGLNLAAARAAAVRDYLAAQGVDPGRLYAIGYIRPQEGEPSAHEASGDGILKGKVELTGFIAPVGQTPAEVAVRSAEPPPIEQPAEPIPVMEMP